MPRLSGMAKNWFIVAVSRRAFVSVVSHADDGLSGSETSKFEFGSLPFVSDFVPWISNFEFLDGGDSQRPACQARGR